MAVNTCVSIIPSSCNEKFLAGAEERLGVGGGARTSSHSQCDFFQN